MTAIDSAPGNKNFLSPLNFKFVLKKTPTLNFFVQKVTIPRMYLPEVPQPNPFVSIPRPGDHITFDELVVTFKVDEDMQNYMEIHNWLAGMGKPRDFDQYKTIASKPITSGEGIYSDIELTVLNSKRKANYSVVFEDAFPIALGDVTFDTTLEDVLYVTADATFKYTSYVIQKA